MSLFVTGTARRALFCASSELLWVFLLSRGLLDDETTETTEPTTTGEGNRDSGEEGTPLNVER